MKHYIILTTLFYSFCIVSAQSLYLGADLSYVNEMEDCGVQYKENGTVKDVYKIFADHGCNMVRLRLWHSPKWYDQLNSGKRYSDLEDVKKSMRRAKGEQMNVLLNFHLSDNWADPSKQLVPEAWLNVVNNLPLLKDSLYNYVYNTLSELNQEGLIPEMVQIGNETNRGILLSPADNNQWTLNWNRNSQLFNIAIKAVRDFEKANNAKIEVALHLAAPEEAGWLLHGFLSNGVVDFDVIGLSYYWAWHKPTTIQKTGEVIKAIKQSNPDKKVMVFETGYIWTHASNDSAPNIISEVHPSYSPASPQNQLNWMLDLTSEVMKSGGIGVLYWEPAWVSSPCFTQWGKGSHQEHATFFDFSNNLINNGGIAWMNHSLVNTSDEHQSEIKFSSNFKNGFLYIESNIQLPNPDSVTYNIFNISGQLFKRGKITDLSEDLLTYRLDISDVSSGWNVLVIKDTRNILYSKKFIK